jgi:hypothetical protein
MGIRAPGGAGVLDERVLVVLRSPLGGEVSGVGVP